MTHAWLVVALAHVEVMVALVGAARAMLIDSWSLQRQDPLQNSCPAGERCEVTPPIRSRRRTFSGLPSWTRRCGCS